MQILLQKTPILKLTELKFRSCYNSIPEFSTFVNVCNSFEPHFFNYSSILNDWRSLQLRSWRLHFTKTSSTKTDDDESWLYEYDFENSVIVYRNCLWHFLFIKRSTIVFSVLIRLWAIYHCIISFWKLSFGNSRGSGVLYTVGFDNIVCVC